MKVWLNLTVEVTQSCPTLCDPMDCSPRGILQARIQEWVAIPFSRGSSWPRDWTRVSCIAGKSFTIWTTKVACLFILITGSFWDHEVKVKVKLLSRVRLSATSWTVAYEAPPSMGFSRQEYRSGLPFPSSVYLPDSGIKPASLACLLHCRMIIYLWVTKGAQSPVYKIGISGLKKRMHLPTFRKRLSQDST